MPYVKIVQLTVDYNFYSTIEISLLAKNKCQENDFKKRNLKMTSIIVLKPFSFSVTRSCVGHRFLNVCRIRILCCIVNLGGNYYISCGTQGCIEIR